MCWRHLDYSTLHNSLLKATFLTLQRAYLPVEKLALTNEYQTHDGV